MTIIQAQPLKQFGISGPASALNNEVPLFDGATGKKIKAGSGILITAGSAGSAQGQLGYWDHTLKSWVHTETNELFWDDTNKRLGIGKSSPLAMLHMLNSSKNVGVKLEQSTDVGGHLWWATGAGYVYIDNTWDSDNGRIVIRGRTSGIPINLMTLKPSAGAGFVGVGTNNPAFNFHLSGATSGTRLMVDNTNASDGDCLVSYRKPGVSEWATGLNDGAGDRYEIANSGALGTNTRFIILPGGNVCFGASAPVTSAKLELSSTTGALLLTRMTEAQRDALTPVNGMLLYNSTTNKFQGRENGAWANLI